MPVAVQQSAVLRALPRSTRSPSPLASSASMQEGFLNTYKSSCMGKEELEDFSGSNAELFMQRWSIESGLCVGQCHGQVEQCLHF